MDAEPAQSRLLCLAVVTGAILAATPALAIGFTPITVTAKPITQFEFGKSTKDFGELEFHGGLILRSSDRDFGSLSGLDFLDRSGTILSVADTGLWFRARLVEKAGELVGIADAKLAPILDAKGQPRRSKYRSDAESLRVTTEGGEPIATVSFEQTNEVSRFSVSPDVSTSSARPVTLPAAARNLHSRDGFETLAIAPAASPLKGATVLVAERLLDKNNDNRAWIVGGPSAGTFAVRKIGDFSITDGAFAPNGDLFILERLFNMAEGVGARIRRIAAADIRPGATVDGPVVLLADYGHHQIDNMEGLALRQEPDGRMSVFIVSDDNNNAILQQTIILKFVWKGPKKPA